MLLVLHARADPWLLELVNVSGVFHVSRDDNADDGGDRETLGERHSLGEPSQD